MSSFYNQPDSGPDFLYLELSRSSGSFRRAADRLSIWRGRRAALMGGTVAAVAALLLAGHLPGSAPLAPIATVEPAAPLAVAEGPTVVEPIAPVVVAMAAPPAVRPVAPVIKPAAPSRLKHTALPPERPQPVIQALAQQPSVLVTVSTRNVDKLPVGKTWVGPFPAPVPRPDRMTVAMAKVAAPDLGDRPMRRPGTAAVFTSGLSDEGRPARRPVVVASLAPPSAAITRSLQSAPTVTTGSRPEPRPSRIAALAAVAAAKPTAPAAPAPVPRVAIASVPKPTPKVVPVKVASLEPKAFAPMAPQPAPVVVRPTPVVARVAPAPAPVVAMAAPASATVARVASQQPVRIVPAPKVVRAPEPARVAALAPAKPQPVVRKPAPVEAPQRTASRKATEREGVSRGAVSLIGVFGSGDERRALILMPNGAIERVRPGDSIRGAQVASVNEESVLLRGGGRDTLLRLPD